MELSLMLMGQIAAMVLIVLAGYLITKLGLMDGEQSRVISRVVVYVIVPCTLLNAFQTEFEVEKVEALAVSCVAAVLIHMLYLGLTWGLSRGERGLTPAEQGSIVYTNAGNLIIPLILGTLGSEYVIYTCPYMTVQSLLIWTHGQALMGGGKGLTVKKVVTNPCLVSIFLGLVLFFLHIQLPGALGSAVSSLGSCIGPMSMLVIGVLLAETNLKEAFSHLRIYWVIFLRLMVYPLLTVLLLLAVGRLWGRVDGNRILLVTLLCSSGPPAPTLTQLAQLFNNPESGYTSSINAVTTVLCAATMPVMILLFQLLSA